MSNRALLLTFLLVVTCARVHAQAVCPTTSLSNKLICITPQLYSANGVDLPNKAHSAHFDNDFEARATALNSAIGTELTAIRLASPASGIVFTFDRALGVTTRMTESYGPILGERAETLGRRRLFLAATYQFFPFSSLDGISLKHVPAIYTHADTVDLQGNPQNPKTAPSSSLGFPAVELEYIRTFNNIDLKVHQFTLYATYGLTNRIEVSAVIPILNVRMGVTSNATIVRDDDTIQQPLSPNSSDPVLKNLYAGTGPIRGCAATSSCSGFFHYFDPNNPATSLNATFARSSTASGIGDVVFRAKGTVWKGERAAAALGAEVRVPTGDEKNFLGAGGAGLKPFITASYRARISPHMNLGYQFNGSSILAGDLTTGKTARLPDQFFYSGGVDVGFTKRLTGAIDLLGQRLFGAPRVKQTPFVDVLGRVESDESQIVATHGSFNMNDLAVGAKYSPFGNFLLHGNLLFRLDNGGLRARVVPLVGVSYTF
jgi:hypothetical protein